MQSISPETIFRGNYAWGESLPQIIKLTNSPLILGRGSHTNDLRNKISIDLRKLNIIPIFIGGSQDLTSSIYKSFEKNN